MSMTITVRGTPVLATPAARWGHLTCQQLPACLRVRGPRRLGRPVAQVAPSEIDPRERLFQLDWRSSTMNDIRHHRRG